MRYQTALHRDIWYALRDSNPEPAGYEPDTLTIELRAHNEGGCQWIQRT